MRRPTVELFCNSRNPYAIFTFENFERIPGPWSRIRRQNEITMLSIVGFFKLRYDADFKLCFLSCARVIQIE